jgi:hypothetical protein
MFEDLLVVLEMLLVGIIQVYNAREGMLEKKEGARNHSRCKPLATSKCDQTDNS